MRRPRSSISTYALKHGVGVPHCFREINYWRRGVLKRRRGETSFMFFRFSNYTYLNGLDFLITISAGMNDILVFHSRPANRIGWYLRLWGLTGPGMQFFLPFLLGSFWPKKRPNRPRNDRDRSLNLSSLPNIRAHSVSLLAIYVFRTIFVAIIF